jgi:ribosome-binding protein aMBF1 (putative translation factor)
MIKNEREYKITKASLAKFESALKQLERLRLKGGKDAQKLKLQEAAAKSMRNELQEQLDEYEQLKCGKFKISALDVVEAIPTNLIRARIALGWTQRDLAQRLGTTEQQIQKYEATDYESASFRKIAEIASILKEASAPAPERSRRAQ